MKPGPQRDICPLVFIAVLFTIAKIWKPKCLLTSDKHLRHCELSVPGFFEFIKYALLLSPTRVLKTSFPIPGTLTPILTSTPIHSSDLSSRVTSSELPSSTSKLRYSLLLCTLIE